MLVASSKWGRWSSSNIRHVQRRGGFCLGLSTDFRQIFLCSWTLQWLAASCSWALVLTCTYVKHLAVVTEENILLIRTLDSLNLVMGFSQCRPITWSLVKICLTCILCENVLTVWRTMCWLCALPVSFYTFRSQCSGNPHLQQEKYGKKPKPTETPHSMEVKNDGSGARLSGFSFLLCCCLALGLSVPLSS